MEQFQVLDIKKVFESPLNPRRSFNEKKMEELIESIQAKGILMPLLVRPNKDRFEIAAGHRRYRAAIELKLTEVPLIIREMSDNDFLEVLTIENLQHEDVLPLEEAQGFRTLMEKTNYDVAAISLKVGKYVVGFMFNKGLDQVLLIRKNRPPWQAGRMNGVGGHIEKGEKSYFAMAREFKEETGIETEPYDWSCFAEMSGKNDGDGENFTVDLFVTTGNILEAHNQTDECLEIVKVSEVNPKRLDMLENLPWLISLALDHFHDGRPRFVVVRYD